jgi:hypothetical protein
MIVPSSTLKTVVMPMVATTSRRRVGGKPSLNWVVRS